jgi:16S rRNA (uracil1498-N3)-methyltransferase
VAPSFVWVPELPDAGSEVELPDEEAHYLRRVIRARPGDLALATDGRGALAELKLGGAGRRLRAQVERIDRIDRDAPRRRALLLCGAPEGTRADWMVEKLAELGIDSLQPIDCARGRWRAGPGATARWGRLAVAALRQSRRRFLMKVREPLAVAEIEGRLPESSARWVLDPQGRSGVSPAGGPGWSVALVGPASGLDPDEKQRLAALDFRPMCLSDGRLRTETAAIAWAAWWASTGC